MRPMFTTTELNAARMLHDLNITGSRAGGRSESSLCADSGAGEAIELDELQDAGCD